MLKNKRPSYTYLLCRIGAALALVIATATTHVAQADDIDAYSNPPGVGGLPNILFILDNSANWSGTIKGSDLKMKCEGAKLSKGEVGTKMGAEKCALYTLFSQMSDAEFQEYNFAFMIFNESPYSSGYPRMAFTNGNLAMRQKVLDMITGLDRLKDAGNNAATAESFYEAWLWFTGSRVHLGDKTVTKNDENAFADKAARTTWLSPGIGCAKNHIIYLANGFPQDNNTKTEELLKKLNPAATRFRIPVSEGVGNSDEANWADEFAAFFNRTGDLSPDFEGQQTIQVHTIAVTGAPSDGNFPNFFKWVATQGGGEYREAKSPDDILEGIRGALNSIRASNSSFSSAALPASANTQGAYLNQVFIGMFRPDSNALPRWVGNLKQYQFKYDEIANTLELVDSTGITPAVSSTTGFISSDAISFWTQPSEFWINAEIASSGKISRSDSPDGPLVEKGGVGQWLRSSYFTETGLRVTRPVYTCLSGYCGGSVDLKSAGSSYQFSKENSGLKNAIKPLLPAGRDDPELLINWIRGEENVADGNVLDVNAARDQLTRPPTGSLVRPSIHGDVLHSRPVALNYSKVKETPRVVVFYGANDGMLRAINGNKTGTGAGSELWAFVAPEHFATLNRLRENDPEVLYPSTPDDNKTATKRNYFFDGPIGAYQNTQSGKVMIYATMRRGGRSVYAFDVTDPEAPILKWRINESTADYSSGDAQIGQTWSTPRVAPVKGHAEPVLIMGGGYDNVAEETGAASTTMGKGVYIIDPLTGARLGHLVTDHSVPSDITFLDSDGDGYVDRAYAIDVRANLYRIDMEKADGTGLAASAWTIRKLANFNDASGARRVFFAPDAVRTKSYTALMLGTGDRENPLKKSTNDRFFIFKDRSIAKGDPGSVTVLTEADTTKVKPVGDTALTSDPDACYVQMDLAGEKVINQPITFGGVTYFSTSRPSTSAKTCSTMVSKAYQVPLICRAATSVELAGDGLPPSPVVGYVEVAEGKVVPFVIGGPNAKKSAIEVERPKLSIPGNRKRTYWFMDNRDR